MPEIMSTNEAFLSDIFEYAAELGNVPVTLLGDLNVPPEMSGALQAAVSTGRWIDAALECATARACEPANTCFVRETSVGSRIDVAWFNNVAAAALIACNTISDTGFPTHVPLVAEVQLARYEQFVRRNGNCPVTLRSGSLPLQRLCGTPRCKLWMSKRCGASSIRMPSST